LTEIRDLAERAIFGTPSESYRTCGNPRCRCHRDGPKHGPHLYVTFRGNEGKTTGYYVPTGAQQTVRAGVAAWHALQERLRELAELNKERALARARVKTT
jgi:hypothetical protein